MTESPPEPVFGLLPEVETRALLARSTVRFRLLRPPFAAIGTGTLRTLRVTESAGVIELVAGYDGYERIDSRDRPSAAR